MYNKNKVWGWVMVTLFVLNVSTTVQLFNKGDGWWVFGVFIAGACAIMAVIDLRKGYRNGN